MYLLSINHYTFSELETACLALVDTVFNVSLCSLFCVCEVNWVTTYLLCVDVALLTI